MKELRESHIINTAIDLFAEYGIRNVSVGRIAEKLQISKGQIYYYFKNGKSDIIMEILQMFEELVTKSIPNPKEWEAKDADAGYILSKLFFKFSDTVAIIYRKIVRIILSEMFYNEQIKSYIVNNFIRGREEMLALCFGSLVKNDRIKPLSSDSAARLLNRLLIVYALLDALEFPSDDDALYERFAFMERDCTSFINMILQR